MKNRFPKSQSGFTLIELMVTLAVAAIVLATAIPNFREMVKDNRIVTTSNEFLGMIHLARSEAIRGGKEVRLCKTSNLSNCVTTGGWEQGWIVVDTTDASVLRKRTGLDSNLTLRGNNNVQNYLSFNSMGAMGGTNGQIILCDDRARNDFGGHKSTARVVIISTTGRPRLVKGDDSDVTVNSCSP